MWESIANGLLRGMGVAGWCIGFMAVLGVFLIVVGVLILALSYAFGAEEAGKEED